MRYVGIDLAWSEGHPSGVVVLDEHGRVEAAAYRTELEALAALCLGPQGCGPVVVGVDAPLKVPNETGQREAERGLLRAFAPFRLGAHVANRRRLQHVHGGIRGERLVALLACLGSQPSRNGQAGHAGRQEPAASQGPVVLEVYPHAALIGWFGLPRPLPYKHGDLARRREGLARVVRLLQSLRWADPPLDLSGVPWLPSDDEGFEALSAGELRHLEGLLDAVICAHMAHYYHRWGTSRCLIFGDEQAGQIVTPKPPSAAPRSCLP